MNNNKNEKNIFSGKKTGFGRFFRKSGKNSNKFNKINKGNGFKLKGKHVIYFITFLFVITISFLSGFCGSLVNDYLKNKGFINGVENDVGNVKTRTVNYDDITDIESLVENVMPSVVGVLSPGEVKSSAGIFNRIPFPSIIPPFWADEDECSFKGFSNVDDSKFERTHLGSGFFVRHKNFCYVLTNYHVVKDFVKNMAAYKKSSDKGVLVILKNDLDHAKNAEIIGYDVDCDVAVLKVLDLDESSIKCLEFEDSKNIKVGATVLAIGNPFTPFHNTVTRGIVSGRRNLKVEGHIKEIPSIQTDAAVNPGNSGGPLINMRGKVIGMNTSKRGGSEGVAFATDGETIAKLFKDIVETGFKNEGSSVPTLGIISDENSKTYGVVIMNFTESSVGKKAGLKVGDTIIAFDGVRISKWADLQRELAKKKKGEEVKVTVLRQDSSSPVVNVKVKLGSED